KSFGGDPIERRQVNAGGGLRLLEVGDVFAEVIGTSRRAVGVDRTDRLDRIVDVFAGYEAEGDLSSEPPGRQSAHERPVDHSEDQVAQHETMVGARIVRSDDEKLGGIT